MVFIKSMNGFKIRTKEDAKEFLEKCISGKGYVVIKISHEEAYYIYSSEKGFSYISHRIGNLSDIFNPELRLLNEKNVDTIWKIRKYINKRFFNGGNATYVL